MDNIINNTPIYIPLPRPIVRYIPDVFMFYTQIGTIISFKNEPSRKPTPFYRVVREDGGLRAAIYEDILEVNFEEPAIAFAGDTIPQDHPLFLEAVYNEYYDMMGENGTFKEAYENIKKELLKNQVKVDENVATLLLKPVRSLNINVLSDDGGNCINFQTKIRQSDLPFRYSVLPEGKTDIENLKEIIASIIQDMHKYAKVFGIKLKIAVNISKEKSKSPFPNWVDTDAITNALINQKSKYVEFVTEQ